MYNSPILPKRSSLETPRLELRAFQESDLIDAIDLLMDPEIKLTYMLPDFETAEAAGEFFDKLMALSQSDNHYVYAIIYLGHMVGFVNDVQISGDTIEVGYVVHPIHKNRGFATEALRALIDELFRVGYRCVKCGYFQGNDASRRVMEKSGMKKISKEDDIEYRGKVHHCYYYCIENPFAGGL